MKRLSNHCPKTVPRLLAGVALTIGVQGAVTILPGWDLLHTVSDGTMFLGQHWEGVPVSTYNFAGVGERATPWVDTIAHRTTTVNGEYNSTVSGVALHFEVLQLKSKTAFDPDGLGSAPNDYYYITLQTQRGLNVGDPDPGSVSSGQLSITFGAAPSLPRPPGPYSDGNPSGTYSMEFTVNYDMRASSLNGPIVSSDSLTMSGSGWWSDYVPPGHNPIIEDVNYMLNGADQTSDFWVGFGHHAHAFASHDVTTPEPRAWAMLTAGGLLGFAYCRRRWLSRTTVNRPG